MRFWRQSLRIVRLAGIALLMLVLLAFALIQIQQRIFLHRAQRLLSDFHSIRLRQSTWADAQTLIRRWGAWGRYQGTCTEQDCVYTIRLQDPGLREIQSVKSDRVRNILTFCVPAYGWLGGRIGGLQISFLVEDGFIRRDSIAFMVADRQLLLELSARASQTLRRQFRHDPWILGDYDQLAQHPNYIEGRPGGCTFCMSGEVTFTPYAAPAEIRMLTSYDLSCLAFYRSCHTLPDMLPVAKDWHLYPWMEGTPEPPAPSGPPKPCDISLIALGRDFQNIFVVDVKSVTQKRAPSDQPYGRETDLDIAKVQLVSVLKGKFPWSVLVTTQAVPYAFDPGAPDHAAEHLEAAKRYVILPEETDDATPTLRMNRCGVFPDSPAVESALRQGMSQNDHLRYKEHFGTLSWFVQ